MDRLFEIKGQLSAIYTKYSRYIDRILKFLLALFTFVFINNRIGFSSVIANPLVTVAISIICTFLPPVITMLYAILAVLINVYAVSFGMAIVSAAVFVIMYAMYLRYAPKKSAVVLGVLIAYMFKVPVFIPIMFGLIGTPTYIIPILLGTVFYYMIHYVNSYATLIGTVAETGMLEQITAYAQQLFENKIMWVTMISYGLVLLIVYYIRRLEVDHAWKVAMGTGALVNIIIMALANVIMDVEVAYGSLILSSIFAIIFTLVLEFFVFSVDYTRTEYLQYEDDEYYYYVKAVPKMKVAVPEKTVKRINGHKRNDADVKDMKTEDSLNENLEDL